MPTTGSGKFPYPPSTAIPDVPADILLLAQRVSKMGGKGIGEASDSTALAAFISDGDATTGFTAYYSAANCIVRYNGTAFKLVGVKQWANLAAQTAWASSYSGLLELGSAGITADTGVTYRWNGSVWMAWESDWTTITPNISGLTVGNGTLTGRTRYRAGALIAEGIFTMGSTSSVAGPIRITHPVTASVLGSSDFQIGSATVLDAGITAYMGAVTTVSATTADVRTLNASGTFLSSGGINSTSPMTFGILDTIMWRYEITPA